MKILGLIWALLPWATYAILRQIAGVNDIELFTSLSILIMALYPILTLITIVVAYRHGVDNSKHVEKS
jgi:L-cystine uptake protein TcyP (sodium:dicarboxylate symporter family)